MRSKLRRLFMFMLLMAGGSALFSGSPNAGCFRMAAGTTLVATDFCFIFDCTNGIFGGVLDPCNPVPLLNDCPAGDGG